MDLQKTPPANLGAPAPAPASVDPRRVPMGRGLGWIEEAWPLFRAQPGAWIGATLLYLLILMATGLVPLIGGLASMVLNPMLFAGLMIGASAQLAGEPFRVGHLFAGFERAAGPLAAAGGLYLLGSLAIALLLVLLALAILVPMGIVGAAILEGGTPPEVLLSDPTVAGVGILVLVLAMLLFTGLALAMLFVPALLGHERLPVFESFRASFVGSLRNLLPLTLFGLILLLIAVAGGILAALLPFVGILVFLAGLLVFMPVTILALHAAYRDIYAP